MSRTPTRLLVALLAAAASLMPPTTAVPAVQVDTVAVYHEAKLRKLHLVRPDLIRYPLSFDVIC